jgi:hypothetical protein
MLSRLGDCHGTMGCRLGSAFLDGVLACGQAHGCPIARTCGGSSLAHASWLHSQLWSRNFTYPRRRTTSPSKRNCRPCKLMCYLILCLFKLISL